MAHPNPVPMHLDESTSIVYIDEGLAPLTPVGILVSSGVLISGALDHGSLAGLGDDDHDHYTLVDGSRFFTDNTGTTVNQLFDPPDLDEYITRAYLESVVTSGVAGVTLLNSRSGIIDIVGSGIINVSVNGQEIIVSAPNVVVPNALVGENGITVISGSNVTTISGFRDEFVAASGSLQTQIDALDDQIFVPNALIGVDGITVISGTDVTTISGFRDEFVSASGALALALALHAVDPSAHHTRYTDGEAIAATEPARVALSGALSAEIDADVAAHAALPHVHHQQTIINTTASGFGVTIVGAGDISVSTSGQIITISGEDQAAAQVPNALVGVDGITVISGANVTTISGFYGEFTSASGSLQTQIDNITIASGVTDVNNVAGSVDIVGAGEVFVTTAGQTITVSGTPHTVNTDTVSNAIIGGVGITVTSGVSTTTIDGHLRYTKEENDAILGLDGITIISGTNTITVSGFYTEFVSASGSLQTQIDNIVIASGVTDVNGVAGSVDIVGAGEVFVTTSGQTITVSGTPHAAAQVPNALVGEDGITIISGTNITTVSGFYGEFVSASGSLQEQIDDIDAGEPAIVGAGEVVVISGANVTIVSGTPHTPVPNALIGEDGITIISGTNTTTVSGFYGEFVSSSGSLQTQIDNITIASGVTDVNNIAGSIDIVGVGEVVVTSSGQTITVSGTPHTVDTDTVSDALIGLDGVTIISGTNTTTVSGFYTEFVSASGSLQDQIDDIDAGEPAIVGAGEVVVFSGTNVTIVSGTPHTPVPDALVGVDGITIISGSNTTTVSGFYGEFVNASGSLQTQIDNITTASGVSSVNSLGGDIEIIGKDQVSVTTEGQTIVVSGLPTDPDVDSINTVTGTVTVLGAGEVFVTTAGQTITVSGTPHTVNTDTVSDALVGVDGITIISGTNTTTVSGFYSEFVSASGSLQDQIDDIDAGEPAIVGAGEVVVFSGSNVTIVSGTPHTPVPDALVGVDGITIISGTNTTTVSGFYDEFTSASGSLQTQIDAIDVDEVEPAIIGGVGITVTSGVSTITIDGHLRYTSAENPAIIGVGEVVVSSGVDVITVSGTPHTPVPNALIGVDGITIISGTNTTTVSGFYGEFVSASGSLQTQIDAVEGSDVDSINGLAGDVTVSGKGQVAVTTEGQTIVVSGLPTETDVDAINTVTGTVTVEGAGEVFVTTAGQTITISGTPHTVNTDTVSNALEGVDGITVISGTSITTISGFRSEFVSASGSLQFQIDNIAVDEVEPAIVGGVGITVTSGANTTTIDGHLRYTSAENPAIVGVGEVVVISGTDVITVSGTPHTVNTDTVSDAIVGVDGITVISGTDTTTVSGFYTEFTSASGSLQTQIDNIDVDEVEPAIIGVGEVVVISGGNTITISGTPHTVNTDTVSDAIIGVDGITVISGTDTTTVSGFYTEFTAASGSLQSQIDAIDVDEVEPAIIGGVGITVTSGVSTITIDGHLRYTSAENPAIVGAGEVVVISGTDTITVSGTPHTGGQVPNAIVGVDGITVISGANTTTVSGFRSEFTSASGSLQFQIDNIDVDEIEPAIVGADGITVISGANTITIVDGPDEDDVDAVVVSGTTITGTVEFQGVGGVSLYPDDPQPNTITISGAPASLLQGPLIRIDFMANGNVLNEWLSLSDGTIGPSNDVQHVCIFPCRLAALSFTNASAGVNSDIEIYRALEGDGTTNSLAFTWEVRDTRTARKTDFGPTEVIFGAGDKIAVFSSDPGGDDPDDLVLTVYLEATQIIEEEAAENFSGSF